MFIEDGATSNTAIVVLEWCNKNMAVFWTQELWPPSPDLNPMDFAVWSIQESDAYLSYHANVTSLETRLMHCHDKI